MTFLVETDEVATEEWKIDRPNDHQHLMEADTPTDDEDNSDLPELEEDSDLPPLEDDSPAMSKGGVPSLVVKEPPAVQNTALDEVPEGLVEEKSAEAGTDTFKRFLGVGPWITITLKRTSQCDNPCQERRGICSTTGNDSALRRLISLCGGQ